MVTNESGSTPVGESPVLHRNKAPNRDFPQLRRAFLERLSLRGVSRVFLIRYYQVYQQLNLTCLLQPSFKSPVSSGSAKQEIHEFDELCGFCGSKKNEQGLWVALCHRTRQSVADVIGDRGNASSSITTKNASTPS